MMMSGVYPLWISIFAWSLSRKCCQSMHAPLSQFFHARALLGTGVWLVRWERDGVSSIQSPYESSRQITGTYEPLLWAYERSVAVTVDLPLHDMPHTPTTRVCSLPGSKFLRVLRLTRLSAVPMAVLDRCSIGRGGIVSMLESELARVGAGGS